MSETQKLAEDGRTHYPGCWRDHKDCAVAMVEAVAKLLLKAKPLDADFAEVIDREFWSLLSGEEAEAELREVQDTGSP